MPVFLNTADPDFEAGFAALLSAKREEAVDVDDAVAAIIAIGSVTEVSTSTVIAKTTAASGPKKRLATGNPMYPLFEFAIPIDRIQDSGADWRIKTRTAA